MGGNERGVGKERIERGKGVGLGGNERGVGKREDRKGKGVGWGEMKGGRWRFEFDLFCVAVIQLSHFLNIKPFLFTHTVTSR